MFSEPSPCGAVHSRGLGSATAPSVQTLLGRAAHLIHVSFLPVTEGTQAFFLVPVSNFITAGSQREMPPAFLGGAPSARCAALAAVQLQRRSLVPPPAGVAA